MQSESALDKGEEQIKRETADRQSVYRREVEDYFRAVSMDYEPRQAEYWHRDYSSVEAFLKSVEPNRQRWLEALGDFSDVTVDPEPTTAPWFEDEHMRADWITVQFLPGVHARAVLALPRRAPQPAPLVVCQHGIGSAPDHVFGLYDPQNLYHAFGRRLAAEGFAVLAPVNVTEARPRARLTRMATMLGKSLWGLEVFKLRRLLDYLETRAEVDVTRAGMYGISLGGAYTLLTLPLEPRLRAGVCCAWFNHRRNKMVIDDPRYSCFLSTEEEHIFIRNWLTEFTDSDLVSLICPRPFLVETGKADGISWWPQVLEEFAEAKSHYDRLGLADRIDIDLHDGGHEIRMDKAPGFFKKWLMGEGG